ncbi:MAG: NAD(+) synthetase, partial [Candidatus Methanomethylicia archaeon]|nr:NAD(+) synthetase [Candidatus Methanomethylicia archaeon]
PPKIVNKRSSPRLWRDQLAEEELGMPYSRIDAILYAICDLRLSVDEVVKALGEGSQKDVISLVERIERNRHKLSAPPIAKITD